MMGLLFVATAPTGKRQLPGAHNINFYSISYDCQLHFIAREALKMYR